MGTKGYMAPEAQAKNVINPERLDIFSAGVILFIMVSGGKPFMSADVNDNLYKMLA